MNLDAAYERPNDRIIGLEFHFVGRQATTDTLFRLSREYVTIDARLEKHVGPAIIFVRGKNLTGVRQSQYLSGAAAGVRIGGPVDQRRVGAARRTRAECRIASDVLTGDEAVGVICAGFPFR